MQIDKILVYKTTPNDSILAKGVLLGIFNLEDRPKGEGSGDLKGTMLLRWYINKSGELKYDDLKSDEDWYCNNQYIGKWAAYNYPDDSYYCHWGERRIPLSHDLDIGTTSFKPNPKYYESGWGSMVADKWKQELKKTIKPIEPNKNSKYVAQNSDYIFNQDSLYTFELKIDTNKLAFLDGAPVAETYVEGALTFNGETINHVGIRYKGSIGAFVGGLSNEDWMNPSGHKTATKLSMKIKINWVHKNSTFYGLKKLQFHSMNLDPTQMHDRLGYWMFRQMGVPAPRAVHARLVINGEYIGLFCLIEQVDEQFANYNFPESKGVIYKEFWPISSNGEVHQGDWIANNIVSNTQGSPSKFTTEFGTAVAEAKEAQLPTVIKQYMNVEEMAAYAAVDRMIKNDDGPFHWYCDDVESNECGPHNFYWYENTTSGKYHLIPWDLDNAFDNLVGNNNTVIYIPDAWGEASHNCDVYKEEKRGSFPIKSAACDKLIRGCASYTAEYEQKKKEFLAGPFSEATVDALLDKWSKQIKAATKEASAKHKDALTVERWERKLTSLIWKMATVREK